MKIRVLMLLIIGLFLYGCEQPSKSQSITVYSSRQSQLIEPLLNRWSIDTGIKVNLLTGKSDELLARLSREGQNSPADLIILSDVARLERLRESGLSQSVSLKESMSYGSDKFKSSDGTWYGLTVRTRPIFYSRKRVKESELSTYEDLSSSTWSGRVCIRSSNSIYNQSLIASMIYHLGSEKTINWLRGLVANLSRRPQGGDRDQIKALVSGECDVAIANDYYYNQLLKSPGDMLSVKEGVGLFWPNQTGRGVHLNLSGVSLLKSSRQKEYAQQLMSYLLTKEAQSWYASVAGESSVLGGAPLLDSGIVFDYDSLPSLGRLNSESIKLSNEAKFY